MGVFQDTVETETAKGAGQPRQAISKDEMQRLVSRNISVSIAARILYLVTRFFLPPIILAFVTLEAYGIWATCFILIGYLGMSAFGVSNVYIRFVAQYHAEGETDKINGLLSTGLVVVSLISLALLVVLWFLLPAIIDAFSVSPDLRGTAFLLIFGACCVFMLDLSLGAFAYVLQGLQRMLEQNLVWVATFLLEAVLIVALLLGGFGIYALLYAFAVRYGVAIAANLVLCYRAIPGLSLSFGRFERQYLKLFFGYGAIVQISGLLAIFLRSVEKLIAGVFIDVRATGLFDVGEKFPMMATSIPASMNAVFLPAASYMHTQARRDEMLDLYLRGARTVNMLTGFIMGYLAAFSVPLIAAWLGPDPQYAQAPLILTLFTLPFQLNVLTGPGSAVFRGIGQPARELIYPVSQLLLVAVFVGLGFFWYGKTVEVIAVTVAAAMILSAFIYLVYTNRFLGLSQKRFAFEVIVPGLVPYLLGYSILLLVQAWMAGVLDDRWLAAGLVLGTGALYCVLSLAVMYRLLNAGERGRVRLLIGKLVTRFAPV